ncbi:MAG: hypothetical protein RLZZ352_1141 [Pseudomonadota bacterium]|jgi:uncharacterized protein (DUF2147 family)
MKHLAAALLGLSSLSALAQMSPVGLWRSMDDQTGQPRAEIRIAPAPTGLLHGRIEKAITQSNEPNCTACTDDRKGQPKLGLEIIRGASAQANNGVWENGKILDPENGKEYTLRMTPLDGGKQLQVRGYIGPFYRTQVWQRLE